MDISALIAGGEASSVWVFAVALMLGALHGLEPGHSKTMMAAYIIAVRGTVWQAVLLGLSAALSHSVVVWGLAYLALAYGDALIGEKLEPYFMMVSGLIVIGIGVWMLWRFGRVPAVAHSAPHPHEHHHHDHDHDHPHALHHHHEHDHGHLHGADPEDAHAIAHAHEIEQRFKGGSATTWQTMMFGLTGGLIPCPAAITVFLLCLNLGQVTLGVVLVGAFSAGLAITLVTVGVIAALGLSALRQRSGVFDRAMKAAPYLSAFLIMFVGTVSMVIGWLHLSP